MTDTIERIVDGVTVRKSFETDEFPVPAVRMEVESSREDPVAVTISDEIPDGIDMDQIGFHPEYHNDQWTAFPEGRVEFKHEFGSRETITTIYGVRLEEGDTQESFLRDPDIGVNRLPDEGEIHDQEGVIAEDAETSEEPVVDAERTNVVREVIEGTRETVPGLDREEEVATANGGESEASASTVEDSESSPEEDDRPGTIVDDPVSGVGRGQPPTDETVVAGDTETLAAALAQELRADQVSDADIEAIQEELGVSKSTETRITHLQARVSDLEAYSSAIEEFIDEHGNAQELLRSIESDLESLSDRVDELDATTADARTDREELREELSETVDSVESVKAELETVSSAVEDLESNLESVENDIDSMDDDLAELDDEVEEQIEGSVAELESDIEAVREDVQDIREWKEQLTTVFGAENGEDNEEE